MDNDDKFVLWSFVLLTGFVAELVYGFYLFFG